MKTELLKDLASKLAKALPPQVGVLKKDFEKQCHQILDKTFSKFNLVTREAFDSQSKVLLRTRQKLDALEKQLNELESVLKSKPKSKSK